MRVLTRTLHLGAAAGICTVLSGLAALYGQLQTLPPTDGLYGASLAQALRDPFVFDVWLLAVTFAGFVGFVCSLPLLWRVRLDIVLLIVLIPTLLAAFVAGAAMGLLAAFCVPVFSLALMVACRARPQWTLPDSSSRLTRTTELSVLWSSLAIGAVMVLVTSLADAIAPGLELWHRVLILLPIVACVAFHAMRTGAGEPRSPRD